MNKKLSRLLEPNLKLYFVVLLLFSAAALPVKPLLAAVEGCITVVLYIYFTRSNRKRRQSILQYIDTLTGSVDTASKNNLVNSPLPVMCLLHLLSSWGREHGLTVTAAHFNHGLRGENADRDAAFVRDWCAGHGVPFLLGGGDTRELAAREHLTVEEAARKLRYAFLERAAAEGHCGWILTAHHADDSAETMAAAPTFQQASIPAIGCSCTNPAVTQNNPYYFRVCFLDPFQGSVMASYANEELKAKKAYVLTMFGTGAELLANEKVKEAYLGKHKN